MGSADPENGAGRSQRTLLKKEGLGLVITDADELFTHLVLRASFS